MKTCLSWLFNSENEASGSLADPGKARGCFINSLVINSFIQWVSKSAFSSNSRHAQTVRVSTSSYKIDYVIIIKNFLNPKGHQNPFSGSKVMAILVKGWIWPIGGASAGQGLACSLRSRLVLKCIGFQLKFKGVQLRVYQGSFDSEPWCTLNWTLTLFSFKPYKHFQISRNKKI